MTEARIAVVGIGCRLRGAGDVAELRARLRQRPPPAPAVPAERWDERASPRGSGTTRSAPPCAHLLDHYDVDALALRAPPATVARLHRMERAVMAAMQSAYADAGLDRSAAERERTSVHIGATTLGLDPLNDHMARVRMPLILRALDEAMGDARLKDDGARDAIAAALDAMAPEIAVDSMMTTAAMAAGRIANALDLGGGHASYDAGFASSLAALIAGVESIRVGESERAIVAGVSPLVTATLLLAHRHRGLLATDEAHAALAALDAPRGAVLGEGAVALVLEREDAAMARGARVYAAVEAHGTSGAGRRSSARAGLECTTEAARTALGRAGVTASEVDRVECQAAGLPAADEAELAGLREVYGEGSGTAHLSSAARHFGFLGAASGMLSVAVAALSLTRTDGPTSSSVLRAGVSSPGLGSVAHHLLLVHPSVPPKLRERHARTPAGVAITGMGVIVPGAETTGELLRAVMENRCHVEPMPPERFRLADHLGAGADDVALAGVVADRPRDARCLHVPPTSLRSLDGAVVLSVDACASALADAACDRATLADHRVGVWVGHLALRAAEMDAERATLAARCAAVARRTLAERAATGAEAFVAAFESALAGDAPRIDEDTLAGTSSLDCAARVARIHDFRGGAVAVDAACASSLAAIHLATRALERHEVDVAVVCGVAWNLFPEYYAALATLGALSFRGSRPFEAGADGMVPGEGAAAIVLEREGERSGARVRARVIGSALASDGRGAAILAPNTNGQERALRRAYARAGVDPASVDLVEAHGTGTATGDSVEVETYRRVFSSRTGEHPVFVGSVKSNIGHLSSGAGLVGVVKTALALENRTLLPTRHRGKEHELDTLADGPLALPLEAGPWPAPPGGQPRRAGVSSFGLGGIDAHVVLEEASLGTNAPAARATLTSGPERDDVATRLVPEAVEVSLPAPTSDDERMLAAGSVVVVVPDASHAIANALSERIVLAGLVPRVFDPDRDASFETIESAARALADEPRPLAGVVDLRSLETRSIGASLLAHDAVRLARRGLAIARALAPRARERASFFHLVATGGGGGLGLIGAPRSAEDGAAAGLLRSLRRELPEATCRAVDFDASDDVAWIAGALLAEATAGGARVEVGYVQRSRVTPTLRCAPRSNELTGLRDLRGAVLFSGGSRGVVLACAQRLAAEGVPCVVTGRTAPARGDEPWARVSPAELAEMRQREIGAARANGETPAQAARRVDGWAERRALAAVLADAAATGLPLEHHVCDVTHEEAVRTLADDVARRHGAVAGVVHGAMFEESRALEDKRPDAVESTLAVKLVGLANLLDVADEHAPRFVVAFGSIAGRLGNLGQTDYAAANGAMARLLACFSATRPEVRCATIEWSAWSGVGAAADPSMAALLHEAGVVAISPEEGSRFFVDELRRGLPDRYVVVSDEQSALEWPGGVIATDSDGEGARLLDDRGVPIDAGALPMIDVVRPSGVVQRSIGMPTDPFLADHTFEGDPVLPGAFALEMLLETAHAISNGAAIVEVRDFSLDAPLRVSRGTRLVRISAESVDAGGGARELAVEARVALVREGRPLDRDRPFCSARVVIAPTRDASGTPVETAPLPEAPPSALRGSVFERLVSPVCLGPRFHHIAWVERSDGGVRGAVRSPIETAIFARTRAPRWICDPLVLDAAFQIASHWEALRPNGAVAVPVAIRHLVLGARRPRASGALVEATLIGDDGRDLSFDVRVTTARGAQIANLYGLTLRRAGPADAVSRRAEGLSPAARP